jgi:hypothetical protein
LPGGVRFRVSIVWIPYPPTTWGAFIDKWCNDTVAANGTAAIPRFWIYPVSTFYTTAVAAVMQKYNAIGFTLDVYTTSVLQVSATNSSRRFPKLFSFGYSIEAANAKMIEAISFYGGTKFVYMHTTGDGYEDSVLQYMNATAARLGGQVFGINSTGLYLTLMLPLVDC